MTHYRERDQEHPGIAACGIPPNEDDLTRVKVDVTCPKCRELLAAWAPLRFIVCQADDQKTEFRGFDYDLQAGVLVVLVPGDNEGFREFRAWAWVDVTYQDGRTNRITPMKIRFPTLDELEQGLRPTSVKPEQMNE